MAARLLVFQEHEIREVATLNEQSLACIEQAFSALAAGRVIMPAPLGLYLEEGQGEVHVKTAYIRGSKGFAVKVATGFYRNAALGLPNSSGVVLYLDSHTVQSRALFVDNGYPTDLQTAPPGEFAANTLAPAGDPTECTIGTGVH